MKRVIAWFAGNSVAANLMMAVILFSGLFTLFHIKREVFPEFESDLIQVSVPYLGAAPEEVEEGVCERIEEAIQGLEGIKEVNSAASEGMGTVTVEVDTGFDAREVLDDVKNRVDAITTFPEETEKPIIQQLVVRRQVVDVVVHGNADERTLKELGERVRDELESLPEISLTELVDARPYEISIEVSEEALRRYGLTFDRVADAVRRSSLDVPGGSIKTEGGEILLRAKGQAYHRPAFEKIPLLARPDGTYLRLGDVANVVDGFADTDQSARFDDEPCVVVKVYRVGQQDALQVAEAVKRYVRDARAWMPEGTKLTTWQDDARILRSRTDLLLQNGMMGFVLVFLTLALFLRFRLAFWVSVGIPVAFLGTAWLLPSLGVSINLISLFAFILVLGIVVDDAIVVSESIYTEEERFGAGVRASVEGTYKVAVPVIFAVLTTVAAFLPLLFVEGTIGKIWRVIPLVVIPTLLFSLLESQWILPAHLAHGRHAPPARWGPGAWWIRVQGKVAGGLDWFIRRIYRPGLEWALRYRYLTAAQGVAVLLLMVGLAGGGWIKFSFFPPVEAENVVAVLTMPLGTPADVTAQAVARLEKSAEEVRKEIEREAGPDDPGVFRHVMASVGEQPYRTRQSRGHSVARADFSGSHLGEVNVELAPTGERPLSSEEIANRWRDATGAIPGAVELDFVSSLFSTGEPINVQLTGHRLEDLRSAADRLKEKLASYPGVFDISDSFRRGKREIKLGIQPEAETLGLTLADLARQVRQAFYGEEAQRIQRGRDDIRVMVRYPREERRSLGDLDELRIRTRDGGEVPFRYVARAVPGRGYETIRRRNRRRAVNVTADVDTHTANANEILADLEGSFLPGLRDQYPGLLYSFEGQQKEQRESMRSLTGGFLIALFLIFALLAVPLRSYFHPLLIMSAIPFGLVGATLGHMIMGMQLTIFSMVGLVALAGVVVNDSLVMVDYVNRFRAEGHSAEEAARVAGAVRFRPILLTSLTTFAGLSPLMFAKNLQAQFLIPMAVSLAYGVMFSTFVTLVLVPAGYLILEDVRRGFARFTRRFLGWELDLKAAPGRHAVAGLEGPDGPGGGAGSAGSPGTGDSPTA